MKQKIQKKIPPSLYKCEARALTKPVETFFFGVFRVTKQQPQFGGGGSNTEGKK